jgi:hypothetical protein
MQVVGAGGKTSREIPFDYETAGAMITSLAAGPKGVVYASTCHPMHLLALDTKSRRLRDIGPIPKIGGGNFCAITRHGNLVIGAEYAQGQLWAYDTTRPWQPLARRPKHGVPAEALYASATVKDGYTRYFPSHDIFFLRGHKVGAEARFKLTAPADGRYYLSILPYGSPAYGVVQFLLDGEKVGEPYVATAPRVGVRKMLEHGPFDLRKGEHHLTVRIVEAVNDKPMCGIAGVDLGQRRRGPQDDADRQNPVVLAQWARDICRPRTVLAHPNGRHLLMAGYAGYGLVGGGIGIYDLKQEKATLLTADRDLLSGHSCITLKALPNGNLVGGTSVAAPGGGHATVEEAELFILDWKTRKIVFRKALLPGHRDIISIEALENHRVYGLTSRSRFFVFDARERRLVHSENYDDYGRVVRHALQRGPDGELYGIMSRAIVRIDPETLKHEKLAEAPTTITAGGAFVNGLLYFTAGSHVWSYEVPGLP